MASVVTMHHPDGRVERDPEAFWLATVAAISALLAEDSSHAGRIAARSGPWAQIFADIYQLPVEICEAEEVGALGRRFVPPLRAVCTPI